MLGSNCAQGFMGPETLYLRAQAIDFVDDVTRDMLTEQQHIIPDMSFTSDGTLMRWMFAAEDRGTNKRTMYPEFQIWRGDGSSYTRVNTTAGMQPTVTDHLNVYEYVLADPWPVQDGDILGIFLPKDKDNTRLSLYFQESTGPVNYIQDTSGALYTFFTAGADVISLNLLPLVVVEFSELSCISITMKTCLPLMFSQSNKHFTICHHIW